MRSSAKMALNTAILYVKLIITIIVNLYATRLILLSLGVSDYGIVNLISGIVAMLSFIQNSMTVSTQRYLSVSLGKTNIDNSKKVFNTSIFLHVIIAIIVLLILESSYPLIFNSFINIPEQRLEASFFLYQLMIISTIIVILAVPFDASLNAHENMLLYSVAGILEAILKLIGAVILVSYNHDKIVFYGFLILFIRLFSTIVKVSYCNQHYEDAKVEWRFYNKSIMKEMFSFSFWNLFGALAWVCRSQGIAIVLNVFGGIVVNAAYGISHQVSGQLSNFTATITKAMAPQIMKSKGTGDIDRMQILSLRQSKYTFVLLLMMSVPLYIDMDFILSLWLKEVPDSSVMFCRLAICVALLQQISSGLMSLVQANGDIRIYQLTVSFITILCIPFSAGVLYWGAPIYSVFVVLLILELLALIARILFSKYLVHLSLSLFSKEVLFPIGILSLLMIVVNLICNEYLLEVSNSVILNFSFHLLIIETTILIGFFLTIRESELKFLVSMIKTLRKHNKKIV